jgi:hypothetical protein
MLMLIAGFAFALLSQDFGLTNWIVDRLGQFHGIRFADGDRLFVSPLGFFVIGPTHIIDLLIRGGGRR